MKIDTLDGGFTVCKIKDPSCALRCGTPFFLSITDSEISLVCPTGSAPAETSSREDGWRCFRVAGKLDFSLTGILSKISGALAARGIPVFAVSTYDTDYVLVKEENLGAALAALADEGFGI